MEPTASYGTRVGYVSLKVDLAFGREVYNAVSGLPIVGSLIKPHDMHMTLMYDSSNPIRATSIPYVAKSGMEHSATVTSVGILGDDTSAYRAVVLKTESSSIRERFEELSTIMTHSFEDHIQHISIAYGVTDADFEEMKKVLTAFIGRDIILYGESFATVKED